MQYNYPAAQQQQPQMETESSSEPSEDTEEEEYIPPPKPKTRTPSPISSHRFTEASISSKSDSMDEMHEESVIEQNYQEAIEVE